MLKTTYAFINLNIKAFEVSPDLSGPGLYRDEIEVDYTQECKKFFVVPPLFVPKMKAIFTGAGIVN